MSCTRKERETRRHYNTVDSILGHVVLLFLVSIYRRILSNVVPITGKVRLQR